MRRHLLTLGNVLIYRVNFALSLRCDLLNEVAVVKHNLCIVAI